MEEKIGDTIYFLECETKINIQTYKNRSRLAGTS